MLIRKNTDQASGKLRRRLQRAVCLLAVCLLLVQTGMLTVLAAPAASVIRSDELRGVWISYLDWEKMPADQEAFKREVDKMLDRCVELKMNAVFVHVRPDADSMYPSSYFPWSRFVTGTQGHNPGYDPFAIFVKTAHSKGLQIHAWAQHGWHRCCLRLHYSVHQYPLFPETLHNPGENEGVYHQRCILPFLQMLFVFFPRFP